MDLLSEIGVKAKMLRRAERPHKRCRVRLNATKVTGGGSQAIVGPVQNDDKGPKPCITPKEKQKEVGTGAVPLVDLVKVECQKETRCGWVDGERLERQERIQQE